MKVLRSIELLKKIYDKLLNEIAKENDITLNELKVLMFLNCNTKNNIARNIVEGLGSTKSHISMSVSDLEQKGYIEKKQDDTDKKKSHLELTTKSYKVIEAGIEVQKQLRKIMTKGLTKEELDILVKLSKKMQDNLEEYIKNC